MNKSWRRGYIAGLRRAIEIMELEKRLSELDINDKKELVS